MEGGEGGHLRHKNTPDGRSDGAKYIPRRGTRMRRGEQREGINMWSSRTKQLDFINSVSRVTGTLELY